MARRVKDAIAARQKADAAWAEWVARVDAAARETTAEESRALHQAGDDAAELVRQGKLTKRDALQQLARDCPGFTADSYEKALSGGMFNTR